MNPRIARCMTALYPHAWRQRYQYEFEAFLEAHPSNMKSMVNVAAWAIYERFLSLGEIQMDPRQNSFTWVIFSGLATFAAGVNFYWTVADTPLAVAMRSHNALFASWTLVQVGALVLAAVVLLVGRVFFTMARTAFVNRRRDVIFRLAVPVCSAVAAMVWLMLVGNLTRSHWVPTPWDVTGDWAAPANWPPLTTRWVLGSVTFALLIGGLLASAISIKQAVSLAELSKHARGWFAAPSIMLAGSVALMAIGVLSWGWFAQQCVPVEFHVRNGGLFSSTNFASWAATCIVLLAAALMAVKSVRSAFSLSTR